MGNIALHPTEGNHTSNHISAGLDLIARYILPLTLVALAAYTKFVEPGPLVSTAVILATAFIGGLSVVFWFKKAVNR